MSINPWIKKELEGHKVPYEELDHPTTYTAQQLAHSEHTSGHRVAKVVIVYADGEAIMLVLPASHRVSLGRIREIAAAEDVHLASERDLRELFPDCELGAEAPLPHKSGMQIWMDRSMRVEGPILFSGGTHRDAVRMTFENWFDLSQPRVENFAFEAGRFPPKPVEVF
jgi:Ala-tRNA(Pro) deacylase